MSGAAVIGIVLAVAGLSTLIGAAIGHYSASRDAAEGLASAWDAGCASGATDTRWRDAVGDEAGETRNPYRPGPLYGPRGGAASELFDQDEA